MEEDKQNNSLRKLFALLAFILTILWIGALTTILLHGKSDLSKTVYIALSAITIQICRLPVMVMKYLFYIKK